MSILKTLKIEILLEDTWLRDFNFFIKLYIQLKLKHYLNYKTKCFIIKMNKRRAERKCTKKD